MQDRAVAVMAGPPRPLTGRPVGQSWPERTGWTLAGATLVVWALQVAPGTNLFPWVSLVAVLTGLGGLAVAVAAWLPATRPAAWRWPAWGAVLLAGLAFGVWAYLRTVASPGYGTDELAFDQYAAQLVVHGLNPYTHSMAPAIARFNVSPDGWTYHLNGRPVTTLSYPALAFLLYTPLLALGWSSQAAAWVNIGAWMAAVAVLFAVVPRSVRPLAIVLGSLGVYVSYAAGGVTDALFVPFLIGAVAGWDRWAEARGWRRWLSPVLMGLALAVKQTPWFVCLFLVVAIVCEARHRGASARVAWAAGGRYLAIAAGAFLVPNLWFLAVGPVAWLHGVLAPFGGGIVPAGQGLIALSLSLGVGGGSLTAYTVAAGLVLLALLVALVVTWPALRSAYVLLPSVVLFFATRALGSYLVELLPVALAAAVTIGPTRGAASRSGPVAASPAFESMAEWASTQPGSGPPALARGARRRGAWGLRRSAGAALAGMTALALAGIAVALLSPAPLAMRIVGVHTTGQLDTIDRVTVAVRNTTGRAVRPRFAVARSDALTTFWRLTRGPARLGPGQWATYTLVAPNTPAMPPVTGGFQVLAFTQAPDAVSRTGAYLPTTDHLTLLPQAINQPVVVGEVVTVRAQLLDALDRPIHQAGVPVYLGQIVYRQSGPIPPATTIDGSLPGQTPVMALTNRDGTASFTVRGTRPSADAVYFEANLVSGTDYYPYGYSPILMVYFTHGPQ